jgi:HEAT repeat protein
LLLATPTSLLALDDEALLLKDTDFTAERLKTLTTSLKADLEQTRVEAMQSLQALGPEGRLAVPALIECLSDNSAHVPYACVVFIVGDEAARTLTGLGAEAVDPLLQAFPTAESREQTRIAFAVRMMGPAGRPLLPLLLKKHRQARAKGDPMFLEPIAAIDPHGKTAFPLLLKTLQQDPNQYERVLAAQFLERTDRLTQVYWKERAPAGDWFRESPEDAALAAAALIAALRDESSQVRAAAAFTLASYPEAAPKVIPALIRVLDDDGTYFRAMSNHVGGGGSVKSAAASTLSKFTKQAELVIDELGQTRMKSEAEVASIIIELAGHTRDPLKQLLPFLDGEFAEDVIPQLAGLGPTALPAVAKLDKLVAEDKHLWSAQLKVVLACVDPEHHPAAVKYANDQVWSNTEAACRILLSAGKHGRFAIPLLARKLRPKGENSEIDDTILQTLAGMGPEAATVAPEVIKGLDEGFDWDRDRLADALVEFGPTIVPQLIIALREPQRSAEFRIRCLRILGRFGSQSAKAVPIVTSFATSEYPRLRETVAKVLGELKSRPSESLPALQRLLDDPRPFVRAAAATACGQFGPQAHTVLAELTKQLDDTYLDVQIAAAISLRQLGPTAKTAIPQLTRLAKSSNELLRNAARGTLTALK